MGFTVIHAKWMLILKRRTIAMTGPAVVIGTGGCRPVTIETEGVVREISETEGLHPENGHVTRIEWRITCPEVLLKPEDSQQEWEDNNSSSSSNNPKAAPSNKILTTSSLH